MNNKTLLSITFLFSLLLLFSCDNKVGVRHGAYETTTLHIDPMEESDPLTQDEYVIAKVLPLENVPSTNLLECEKMELANGRVYILDRVANQRVVVYDTLGHYLHSLGSIGHSTSELLHAPTDFSVSRRTGAVYLFDNESNKIVVYDKDGKFLRACKPSEWPYAFAVTENDNYLFAFRMRQNRFGENYQLSLYNSEGKQETNFRTLSGDEFFSSSDMPFVCTGEETFYVPNLCDTVLVFRGDTIHRAIHLDFGGKYLSSKQQTLIKQGELEEGYRGAFVRGVYRYMESSDWIGVIYNGDGYGMTFLQKRKNGKTYNSKSLIKGLFPSDCFVLEGEYLVFPVTEKFVLGCKGFLEDLSAQEKERILGNAHPVIRDFVSGKRKYPALIYVRVL